MKQIEKAKTLQALRRAYWSYLDDCMLTPGHMEKVRAAQAIYRRKLSTLKETFTA